MGGVADSGVVLQPLFFGEEETDEDDTDSEVSRIDEGSEDLFITASGDGLERETSL